MLPLAARNGRTIYPPSPPPRRRRSRGWGPEFIDAETQQPHEHRVESDVMQRYLRAYARRLTDLWKNAAAKRGIALARVSAEAEFLTALRAEGDGHPNAVEAA